MKKHLNLFLLVAGVLLSLISVSNANDVVLLNKSKIAIVNSFHENLKRGNLEVANDLLLVPPEIQTKKYRKAWFKLLKDIPNEEKNRGWPKWEAQCEKTLTEVAVVLINHNAHNELDPVFLFKKKGKWLIPSYMFFGDYKFEKLVLKYTSAVQMRELHELKGWSLKVIRGYPGFECVKERT